MKKPSMSRWSGKVVLLNVLDPDSQKKGRCVSNPEKSGAKSFLLSKNR
jgi:hypothetical protein